MLSGDKQQFITFTDGTPYKIWDLPSGKLLGDFEKNFVEYNMDPKNKLIIEHGNDKVAFVDIATGKTLGTLVSIDTTGWVFLHPSGLFDASPDAMKKLYWVKGLETIDFEQLKERYWQPGLFDMAISGRPLRGVDGMGELKLQPDIELDEIKNDELTIHLTKRDGGYGKVAVYINNKERIEDARPASLDTSKKTQVIVVNIGKYLVPGIENSIRVKTWSADGFVSSDDKELNLQDEGCGSF